MRVLWLQVSSHEKWSGSVNHVILMLCHSVIGYFHCGSLLIWLDVIFGLVLVTEASLKKKIKCSHAVEASSGGESFDPSTIDLGAVQKSIQEENKFIFSATCSKIVEDGTSRRVCVIFQLLTSGGRGRSNVYWCFKPAYFKGCLVSLNNEANRRFYCPSYAEITPMQVRDTPHGANIGRSSKSKRNNKSYPVEISTVVLDVGGKVNPPEAELDNYIHKVHAITKAAVFKKLFLMVTSEEAPPNLHETITDDNNEFWTALKSSHLQIDHNVPLDKFLLDDDIDKVINSLFGGQFNPSDWSAEVRAVALK
jgi:hypothetical protein